MSNDWQFEYVYKDFGPDEYFDYSCDPGTAREYVCEKFSLDGEEGVSDYAISRSAVKHLATIKKWGWFDRLAHYRFNASDLNRSEGYIDEAIEWDKLREGERRELILNNLDHFKILGYRPEKLQEKLSEPLSCLLAARVQAFLNKGDES